MDYLVFQTSSAAKTALEAIYSNMVEGVDSPDLLDVATGQVIDKDDLTPEKAVQINSGNRHFPIFGKNAASGEKNPEQGYTTAWAEARQTLQGQWVCPKPVDSLMTGISGYTIAPYDPAWFQEAELNG